MKIYQSLMLVALGLVLASCTTYGQHRKIGTYTFNGKSYDVYEAKEDGESRNEDTGDGLTRVRMLVEKGATPPDRPEGAISICEIEDYDSQAEIEKACNKKFTAKLRARLRAEQDDGDSDDGGSMY